MPLPRAGPAQDQRAKDAEADQQAHDADQFAHQRGEGEEHQPGGDPEVAAAPRQQAEIPGRERDRQHGTEAHQPDEAPVRRGAHPADILDRSQPHQRDRGDIGPEREQQAGQRQKAERVQKRVEPRHVGQGGAAAGRHRPQVEQQGMAGIVGDGALGDRHQLALLADGEPDAALERTLRALEPHPGGQPARRHDVGQIAVALGVLERPTELPQHQQSRAQEKDQQPQGFPDWDICQAISATLLPCGEGHRTGRQPADGDDAWRAASLAVALPETSSFRWWCRRCPRPPSRAAVTAVGVGGS